jgi:hypothetical protein
MTPETDSRPGLFQELLPIVRNRTVMITVAALDDAARECASAQGEGRSRRGSDRTVVLHRRGGGAGPVLVTQFREFVDVPRAPAAIWRRSSRRSPRRRRARDEAQNKKLKVKGVVVGLRVALLPVPKRRGQHACVSRRRI